MPPRKKSSATKQLETETEKMASVLKMLQSQIEEERAKVQPGNRPKWASAAEGPSGKFDPHGPLAKKILRQKRIDAAKAKKAAESAEQAQPQEPQPISAPIVHEPEPEAIHSPRQRKIEVIVEPQGGKLWGQYADTSIGPEESGGSLWGPHPDEAMERAQFQEEVAKLRQESKQEEIPKGGALWGAPPDMEAETERFKREVAKIRGEEVEQKPPETASTAVESHLVQRLPPPPPTSFTYFDFLANKDILDDTPSIQKFRN